MRGCTTWAWQATEGDETVNVVVIGSRNVNPGYRKVSYIAWPHDAQENTL